MDAGNDNRCYREFNNMKKPKKKTNETELIIVKRPWYCFFYILIPLIIEAFALYLLFSDVEMIGIQFLYFLMTVAAIVTIWIIVDFIFWSLIYTDGRFRIRTWYGKPREYKKTELKQILEYYSWPQRRTALVLYFEDGMKVPINESYRGYQRFHSLIKVNHFPFRVVE